MQSSPSRSKLVGPALAGLAFLLVLVMLRIAPDATGAFQSPLPTPAGPCFSQSTDGFTLDLYGYVNNDDGTTILTYRVAGDNKKDISYAAFGLGDWTPVVPEDGATVSGDLGDYHVEWTNDRGNPGFASVKYESEFDGFSQGASDYFVVTVADFGANDSVPVQLKAGNARTTFDVSFDGAGCDKTPPPFSPLPTPTATPEGGVVLPSEPVVPQCVFSPPPGGIPDEPVIPLDAYSFSEPQVVMTNTAPIWIQQWLPDNKTLMISRGTNHSNPVILIDTDTGETVMPTGLNDHSTRIAKWLSKDQTVVWLRLAHSENLSGYWAHSLAPPGSRRLSQDSTYGGDFSLDVSPDGKEAIFMSLPGGTQPLIWNQEMQELRALPIDLANWRHSESNYPYRLRPFNVNWQPDGNNIFFWDGSWAFLYNLETETSCEIDMRSYTSINDSIIRAKWSPNGRYLIAQLTQDPPYTSFNGPYGLIWVLDIYTGESSQYNVGTTVTNFTWAADSQTIAFSGSTGEKSGNFDQHGVYLLNIHNGEMQRILSVVNLSVSNPHWTTDGTGLAFYCHDYSNGFNYDDYRVCTSQVSLSQ
ncbi:MAG: PD40 domain-containing protein [Caldilineaceae bacterium]|nr:PD40 domain-containing protein [Caldilineaceae bacterium]